MATTNYSVSGMTCEHCAKAITEEVGAIDGVTDVQVSFEAGTMSVATDADVPFKAIEDAVDEAGDYAVTTTA